MRARTVLLAVSLCLGLASGASGATPAATPASRLPALVAAVPDWGPATRADTLQAHLYAARVRDDEPAFAAARDSLWTRYPHHDTALEESVLWAMDHRRLRPLLEAVGAGQLEQRLGLGGLDASDAQLVRGLAAFYLSLDGTAAKLLARSAAESPPRPAALVALTWLEARLSTGTTAAAAALASPAAAVEVLSMMVLASPSGPLADGRDAALARLATLPARPRLERSKAVAACADVIHRRGLTTASLGAALDELHARRPVACAGWMESLLGDAETWLEPVTLRPVLEARAGWLPAAKLRDCRARLALAARRGHEAYRLRLEEQRHYGGDACGPLIALTPHWHADADEAVAWARAALEAPGDADFDDIAWVLGLQGHEAEADSARARAARERPLSQPLDRLMDLAFSDVPAAAALLDSLRGARPAWALLPSEVFLGEARGDTTFLARLHQEHGDYALATALPLAAGGAAQHGDRQRLARLARWAEALTPDRRVVWRTEVETALGDGDLGAADALIARRLPALAGGSVPIDWTQVDLTDATLALRTAVLANRPAQVRAIVESLLAQPDVDAAYLVDLPLRAEAAGLPDLADRALTKLTDVAPEAPATVLTRGSLLLQRGDLAGARAAMEPAAARWSAAPYFREALAAAGGALDSGAGDQPVRDLAVFGELGLEYEATDWILARAEPQTERPTAAQVILQDRYTIVFQSHDQLTTRHRVVAQVLSEGGGAGFTPYRIAFAGPQDAPRVICARLISPQGEVREVPQSDIMVTAHDDDGVDVSDSRDMVIPFTNLKPGSIVDVCVESTPRTSFAGSTWTHHFGNSVRQREELVEFVVPRDLPHVLAEAQAPVPTERRDLAGGRLYRWSARDLPAVTLEENAPALAAFPQWVGCTTTADWDEVGRRYAVDFWGRAEPDDAIRNLAKELTAADRNDAARLESVFRFVREEVDNVGVEQGRGRYVPSPASEVARRRYGDCKEKIALLTALLGSVGLRCQPVLVGVRPSEAVLDGYPNAAAFDHLVAFVPGVAGGVFCDPTLGEGCRADLPAGICGQRGLLMERDGRSRLVTLPEHDDSEPELEYVVDLRPQAGGALLAEVELTARYGTAYAGNGAFDLPDSAAIARFVGVLARAKTEEGGRLRSWRREELPCGAWRLHAELCDSTWADAGQHDARTAWLTFADDLVDLSAAAAKDRRLPLDVDSASWGSTTIRAHETAGWQLATHMAPVTVEFPGFTGSVTVAERGSGDDRWLEVHRETHLSRREYPAADARGLVEHYDRHKLGCLQPFVWRRREDDARLGKLIEFARANPGDIAFAVQAAQQLLGADLGGDGEAGRARRARVRELLEPALAAGSDATPFLITARMARRDDRWFEADSLLTRALALAPREPELLIASIYVKRETAQFDAAIDLYRRHQAITGEIGDSYALVQLCLSRGRDDDAAHEIERLRLIAPKVDERWLLMSRLTGYLKSHRLEAAKQAMAEGRRHFDDGDVQGFRVDLASAERRWDEAIAVADSMVRQEPLDPAANNNLAWYLACAGRELGRADYAIGVSLAVDRSGRSDNTLALVRLQQGRVEEARRLLKELLADDRPSSRVANGYLLGLSYWLEGDRRRALETWRPLAGLEPYNDLGPALAEALAAAEAGRDPSWLFLRKPTGKD